MEIIRINGNHIIMNMDLEKRVVRNDNKIGKELKQKFGVVGKGKANERQESVVDEEVRNKKVKLILV